MRTDIGVARRTSPAFWGKLSLGCFVLIFILGAIARAAENAKPYDEPFRPQYHFSPATNWMNDPNGCVFFDGEFHLFYQYNPEGDTWGHMSWGHAVSKDLVRWEHLPVALREEDGVMIFSGSAVVDHQNTSGFGRGGEPPLVAIYTGHGHGKQVQSIAYSNDRGRTWTKYEGNPVIDIGSPEFRDPKVMWHEPTKRWVMVVARPDRKQVDFYGSRDLKKWERLGEFGGQGAVDGIWECPDLFELPVMRGAQPTDEKRWVLVVNINGGTPAGGSGCQYFVGRFDGKTFTNDNPKDVKLWADWGPDFYAAQSWSDVPEADGRRIWIAWMSNWRYANQEPTKPWRTAMTLPREVLLVQTDEGPRLAQRIVKEAHSLVDLDQGAGALLTLKDVALTPGRDPLEGKLSGDALELVVVLEDVRAEEVGVKVAVGDGKETVVGYDVRKKLLFLDRTRSGMNFHHEFPARNTAPMPDAGGKVLLHVWLDRSSVEVLGLGGLVSITQRIYPPPGARGVELYAKGGNAKLVTLNARKLKSAWK